MFNQLIKLFVMFLVLAGFLGIGGCAGHTVTFGAVHETPIIEVNTGSVLVRMPTITVTANELAAKAQPGGG